MNDNENATSNQNRYPPLILLIIACFSIIESRELFSSWVNSPIERLSWIFFGLWLLPIIISWVKKPHQFFFTGANTALGALSLFALFLSIILSLNAVAYAGLALSLAACIPWSMYNIPWIISAVSWMPGIGWLLIHWFPDAPILITQIIRLVIVDIGTLIWILRKISTSQRNNNG